MINVQNLTKKYGTQTVLNIEKLEVPKGQSFGLVGNNGAGKTTFFSLLLDLVNPTTGTITSNAVDVNKSEAWKPFTSALWKRHKIMSQMQNLRQRFLLLPFQLPNDPQSADWKGWRQTLGSLCNSQLQPTSIRTLLSNSAAL